VNHGLTLAGYALFVIVVIAIVGFVVYRLREFRREAAQGTLPAEFADPDAVEPGPVQPGPVQPGRARHAAPRSDA
jgi:hypothetical protein